MTAANPAHIYEVRPRKAYSMNELWVAVITGFFTLGGVIVTLWFENKRSAREHTRWYVDHFIGDKLENLRKLHDALVDCHFSMNLYGNFPPQTLDEFKEKVASKQDAYLRAMVIGSMYLNKRERDIFSKALGAFRQANMAIWLSLPDDQLQVNRLSYGEKMRSLDWERFISTYEEASKVLEDKLNPESLREIEKGSVTR
jgi:hypothetical protein